MQYYILLTFMVLNIFKCSSGQKISKQDHKLNIELKSLKNNKDFKNAGISFLATDLSTGEILAELNPDLALSPASTLKLLTTATAIEILGADFRFQTKIKYTGKIDTLKKILFGNIIIEGGGDPTLGSKFFDKTKTHTFLYDWSEAIKNAGIDSITGSIIGDARIYGYDIVPSTWSWEDMGNYFGAGACGLSVYDNFYTLFIKTSHKTGGKTKIVRIEPEISGIEFENNLTSYPGRSDLSYIFGSPYTYKRHINGKLPKNRSEYKIKGSLPDPAYLTACELEKKLKENNIKTGKPATTFRLNTKLKYTSTIKNQLLYTTFSPTLKQIAKKTNFRSVNLFAEHLLNHIGYAKLKQGKTNPAAEFMELFWSEKGMDTGGMSIRDGSGLSKYNTMTAKQMIFLLKYMKNKSKNADVFYNTMAVAGRDGTLRRFCKGSSAQNNMRAKSGSINGVVAYVGYIKTASGRNLAFSIIFNNFNCKPSKARKKIEKILITLSDSNI